MRILIAIAALTVLLSGSKLRGRIVYFPARLLGASQEV
jgi:hypothetical protein